jgi:hypothetical protein
MKNKILCIIICTLLIASSTVVAISSNETQEITKNTEIETNDNKSIDKLKINNNFSTAGSFEQCIAACLGITLAGNCIYLIFGCAISPGPHNFCCWAVPIFCGVDIGILLSCISKCADLNGDYYDEPPCFSENIIRLIKFISNSNSTGPAIIMGLMCLLQRWRQVKDWMKEQGYLNIDLPEIEDCGCKNSS